MHICALHIMCSYRMQKQCVVQGRGDYIQGRPRRDNGSCAAARQRAWASADGWNCRRPWRPDPGYPMGVSGCVGGPVAPKHYCTGRGGRIANLAAPWRESPRYGWMDNLGRFGHGRATVGARRCTCSVSAWEHAKIPQNSAGSGAMVTSLASESRGYFVPERVESEH